MILSAAYPHQTLAKGRGCRRRGEGHPPTHRIFPGSMQQRQPGCRSSRCQAFAGALLAEANKRIPVGRVKGGRSPTPVLQIGRASSRERMWNYVWDSGGPVQLKKKKKP